jgi:hypothetical protein
MDTLSILLAAFAVAWFWLDSLRAREIATGISRAACDRQDVQFLDQTVALRRIGLRWPPQGMRLRRVYTFDYSEEGVGRRTGHLVMLGMDLEELSLGLPLHPEDA